MNTTTVEVLRLRETLESNRKKHWTEYRAARALWEEKVVARLREVLGESLEGNFDSVQMPISDLPKPESFIKSYDTALKRLDWEVESHVDLDETEFANYVLDDWSWRNRWVANTSSYLVS